MKIVVFGNTGSGKSTLARRLSDVHGLAFLELDMIAWKSKDPPARFPLQESVSKIDDFINQHDGWVMEGAYGDFVVHLLAHADEFIFLNPGIEACISNAKSRPWEPHKYKSAKEQNDFLPNLIDWLKQYETREDEFGLMRHVEIFSSFTGKKTEFNELIDYESI